jgi:hypothetical protein
MDRERKEDHDLSIHEDEEVVFTAEHCDDQEANLEIAKAKGRVVLVAGVSACVTVSALAIMQAYSIMKGGNGIGIDLNHILLAYLAGMAMVYKWAFPKDDK